MHRRELDVRPSLFIREKNIFASACVGESDYHFVGLGIGFKTVTLLYVMKSTANGYHDSLSASSLLLAFVDPLHQKGFTQITHTHSKKGI